MKKTVFLAAILMVMAFASRAQVRIGMDIINGNVLPNPAQAQAMGQEERAHPNIAQAMNNINAAIASLRAAPNDFGGHKDAAIRDLHQAWISLRKALYFRLFVDTGSGY